MKILVINGSPKKEKSDVMCITRAFLQGMNDHAPQDVKTINAVELHVEYCTGCFACMHNGGDCVLSDDMRGILKEMTESDLLILSFPLYCYGMPAPLKAVIDRMLPLSGMAMKKADGRYVHVTQADVSKLRFLMVCGCGFPNIRRNFEPAVMQFGLLFPHNGTAITVPESPMFNTPFAAPVTAPRLELVRRAGEEYARTGGIDAELLKTICSPMIPEEQYAKTVNSNA